MAATASAAGKSCISSKDPCLKSAFRSPNLPGIRLAHSTGREIHTDNLPDMRRQEDLRVTDATTQAEDHRIAIHAGQVQDTSYHVAP